MVFPKEGGTPQALWCWGNTLYFICDPKTYSAGDIYNRQTILNVWSGTSITQSGESAPAWIYRTNEVYDFVTKVVFDFSFAQVEPTSLFGWFAGCSKLTKIVGLQYLNTSKVTNMGSLFGSCSGLTNLDLSHFDTSNVTNMSYMFRGCSGLTNLDLSKFNTAKVTNMSYMFSNFSNLTSLDLSHFDTSNVTNMEAMFKYCGQTSLYVGNFDISNVTNMSEMFYFSVNLKTIYCNDTWTCKNSGNMFYGCTSLVGGQGMTYNNRNTNATYANPGVNGYFTKVPTSIETIDANIDNISDGIIYDMSGRLVGDTSTHNLQELNLQPGIYILNGKKIMVR